MEKEKIKFLEKKGWKVGNADEFLELSSVESALIDMKIALSDFLKEKRKQKGLSQVQLSKVLKTSQSRIAKMENIDPLVSIDLLLNALFHLGVSKKQIAHRIAA